MNKLSLNLFWTILLIFGSNSFSQRLFSSVVILSDTNYVSFYPTENKNHFRNSIQDNFGHKVDSFLVVNQGMKFETISGQKVIVDSKLIKYLKRLRRQTIRYRCFTDILEFPGIYEMADSKVNYTIFEIQFYKSRNCNIIRYEKRDVMMYLKHDFRFIFILNTVNKIKNRYSQILQDKL